MSADIIVRPSERCCRACGSQNVAVERGRGPHVASLRCLDCWSFRWLRKVDIKIVDQGTGEIVNA